jgi:L-ribulokinase
MSDQFALGLDFGTESVRALIVGVAEGREAGLGSATFRHGVMSDHLPSGGPTLPHEFALQHPQDYLESARAAVAAALGQAAIEPRQIVGIGIDFTACTPLPVDALGEPLCLRPEFRSEPHAYVKLWKHHGAADQADRINRLARERGAPFLARHGGTTSSEWLLAKAWETLERAPAVYAASRYFLEASDWVVWRLTGRLVRGACAAGYKGLWHKREGWPTPEFLAALDPGLADFYLTKAAGPVVAAGHPAGRLTAEMASTLGLAEGTPVAAPIIDAHAAMPGCGASADGELVIILGTSNCHMLLAEREILVPGIQGVVEDGILPGHFGYEAGQAASGDMFAWLLRRVLGMGDTHGELERRARAVRAGSSGLLALDWWNGNRSVLVDPRLSGLIVGLTLATRSEDLYRALLEASAFGTRKIVDSFEAAGVPVRRISVCGGMAERNELLLDIYASVLNRPLRRAQSLEVCARGAAILGATAATVAAEDRGAFERVLRAMAPQGERSSVPDAKDAATYQELFALYEVLHDQFGRGRERVMEKLRAIRART